MSKDTINPKRWILDEKQLNDLLAEQRKICAANFVKYVHDKDDIKTGKAIVNAIKPPLPNPVDIPSDEEIDKYASKFSKLYFSGILPYKQGMKSMRDLIFNKQ